MLKCIIHTSLSGDYFPKCFYFEMKQVEAIRRELCYSDVYTERERERACDPEYSHFMQTNLCIIRVLLICVVSNKQEFRITHERTHARTFASTEGIQATKVVNCYNEFPFASLTFYIHFQRQTVCMDPCSTGILDSLNISKHTQHTLM